MIQIGHWCVWLKTGTYITAIHFYMAAPKKQVFSLAFNGFLANFAGLFIESFRE